MEVQFKYLGMVVGGNPKKQSFWQPMITKFKNRFSRWKGKYLSFPRRICLIKTIHHSPTPFITSLFTKLQWAYVRLLRTFKENFYGVGDMAVERFFG